MGRRREANHRGERRPGVDMRHHFVVPCARLNVVWPPHDAWNGPSSFEWGSLLTAEWGRSGIGVSIEPSAIVGRQDDDRVGCLRTDGIHFMSVGFGRRLFYLWAAGGDSLVRASIPTSRWLEQR